MYHFTYIGYYNLNIDYIIETYCVNKEKPALKCNGKCHLAKQLSLDIETSENDAKGITSISESFFPVFHQQNDDYNLSATRYIRNKLIRNKNELHSYNFIHNLEQPPDFLS